ncbi:MAG: hypothetical protein GY754_00460 [bacterium]|nr:hypothetical protein [bacterium]
MIDDGFYKSLAPLGDQVLAKYKTYEDTIMYIIGQIAIFDIEQDKFFSKEKSLFLTDLKKVRDSRLKPPSDTESEEFAVQVKRINQSITGFGIKYKMVVTNSLLKVFFGDSFE